MGLRSALFLNLLLILLLSQVAISGFPSPASPDTAQAAIEAVTEAEDSGQWAFLQIQGADHEGGNVSSLTMRFNEALGTLEKAELFLEEGLFDQAALSAKSAMGLFGAIGHDAQTLQVESASNSKLERELTLLSIPLVATSITLVGYFLIRAWQKRRIRLTLRKRIEVRGTGEP